MKTFFTILLSLSFLSQAKAESQPSLISVNGVSEKNVDPNILSLSIEVWSKATQAKVAQGNIAIEYKRVQSTLEKFKVKKEDIQTESYSLNPEYVYDQRTQQNKMTGFRAAQTLRVTVRKTDEAGGLLDGLSYEGKSATAGVNLNSISWDVDNREALQVAGLSDAVKAAKIKAEEIAKAAGVKIKSVYHISHGSFSTEPRPVHRGGFSKSMALAEAAPTELSSGQIKVRVEVQAAYQIE